MSAPASNGDNPMTENLTGAGHNRLGALAAEIVEHHGAARAATREAIRHAIEAGRRLAEAKKLVGHGGWLPWLKANVPGISARTAQRYLAAAERAGKNDTVSCFRLRDIALRPRTKPTAKQKADIALEETIRQLELAGVSRFDAWRVIIGVELGGIVHNTHELGSGLVEVQKLVPPEEWAHWLKTKIGTTPEAAAVLIEAAGAIEARQPWDMEAAIDATLSWQGPAHRPVGAKAPARAPKARARA
jgi:hypothetical protein